MALKNRLQVDYLDTNLEHLIVNENVIIVLNKSDLGNKIEFSKPNLKFKIMNFFKMQKYFWNKKRE